jgi:hypothetical protein
MAEQGHGSGHGGKQALQAAALGAHTMTRANQQQRGNFGAPLPSSSYSSLAALASIPHPQHQSLPHFPDQQQQMHLHLQLQNQLNKNVRVNDMGSVQGLNAPKMMGNKSQKWQQHLQKQRKEDSSEAPQLYETSKVRRPELWQFIRLVVPDPPHIAAGKEYTNQDANQAYCLKCKKLMHYNTGNSNNVSRHMTKFHPVELLQFQLENKKKKKKPKKAKNVVTTQTPIYPQGQHNDFSSRKDIQDEMMEHQRKRQRIENSNSLSPSADASQANSSANVSTSQETDVSCGIQILEKLPSTESEDFDTNQRNSMVSSSSANSLTGVLENSSNVPPRPGLARQECTGNNLLCEDSEVEVVQHLNTLVAKWVCKQYHSFSITEDRDLQAILDYAVTVGKQITLPNFNAVRNSIGSLSAKMRLDLLHQVSQECFFFSTSTDVWSTIEKDVYVSFCIHFLNENFEMRHFTLDVKEFVGLTQSMETLRELLELTLSRWSLDMRYSNVLLWQSNCSSFDPLSVMRSPLDRSPLFFRPQSPALVQNTQIHLESISHALQMILAQVFYSIKKQTDSWNGGFYVLEQQLNDAVDKIPTQFRSGIEFINGQVEYFRELSSILATHPSAITRINKLLVAGALNHLPRFLTDSKNDWFTTLEMLRRMVKLREVVHDFFIYFGTTEGKQELQVNTNGNRFFESPMIRTTPPSIEQWITIECLLQMLQPLENVMRAINKEKFTPLALIFPLLRFLSRDMDKKKNLSNINTPEFQAIMRKYGIDPYHIEPNQANKLTEICQHIETLRAFFHEEFVEKFTRISSDLVWISQLDPRFIRMKYLDDEEREQYKQILAENAVEMANLLHLLSITQQKSKQHLLGSGNSSANSSSNNLSGSSGNTGGNTGGIRSASSSFLDLQGKNDEHDTNMFLRELLFEVGGCSQSGSAEGTPEPSSFSSDSNMHFHTQSFEEQEALRLRASEEVEQFYQQVSTEQVRDPLLWWRSNSTKYPLLGPLARKWLSAIGSVKSSEVLNFTSKEMNSLGTNSRMDPEIIRDMVFVHDNS